MTLLHGRIVREAAAALLLSEEQMRDAAGSVPQSPINPLVLRKEGRRGRLFAWCGCVLGSGREGEAEERELESGTAAVCVDAIGHSAGWLAHQESTQLSPGEGGMEGG